jgi:DNA-binding winged helix-turn-helix (wHTH) protein
MSAGVGQVRQQTFRFCEFELDLPFQTLSHRGVRAKLQKQPFQVLELLVQRAPEIVSREEIRRHVWGDAVYIDATQSINFCIRQIRLALGDTSAGPRFIETLPRQGYRFIATLDEIPGNTGISEHVPVQESRPEIAIRRWLIPGLLALVALAAIIGVGAGLGKRETGLGVAEIRPVSTFPGDEREPSLSRTVAKLLFHGEARRETTGTSTLCFWGNKIHCVLLLIPRRTPIQLGLRMASTLRSSAAVVVPGQTSWSFRL